jgi:tetratricopeptide (TPR) repeat protein
VPKDLTNSSDREERTRFYHHEYQNKLLVGLAEFLVETLQASDRSVLLIIDDADQMSPTSKSLIGIIVRQQRSRARLRFVLLDRDGGAFVPQAVTIAFRGYSQEGFDRALDLDGIPRMHRDSFYLLSRGNLRIGRALKKCFEHGIHGVGSLSAEAVVDFYTASLSTAQRVALAFEYARDGFFGDFIKQRNAETISPELLDAENTRLHLIALERYRSGDGPLVIAHALALSNKFHRIDALVEPCEILMAIGLYDTWFSFFAPMFADPELRSYRDGNHPVNGLFINAAFVLYAMGDSRVSSPFIEEFLEAFPSSQFIPTALYAQSMTYGRYLVPVDLVRAENYATKNLALIEGRFREHRKYSYIKVFAENAYAYIKARQGKLAEALELCERGNNEILAVYGESTYRLHRSILIYNTSQIYEIVGDHVRAEAQLRSAIACDPYYAEYYNDLGNQLSKLEGREPEALDAYARAITLSPPYYEAHLNRGALRSQMGDFADALTDLRRALEIKPSEWRAMREVGNISLVCGDAASALESYLGALAYEDRDADLHANVGLAYSELGDDGSAIKHYHSAIALNPTHATAHNNLAAELVKCGSHDQALQHAMLAAKYGKDPDFDANREAIEALGGV